MADGTPVPVPDLNREHASGQDVIAADDDCEFCRIASGEAEAREVLRTDTVVGFFPLSPAAIGHTLLIPRVHVPEIWALNLGLAATLAHWTVIVADALRATLHPQGLNVVQSNGAAASQTVMHLHIHLVPRWEGDALPRLWPTAPPVFDADLDETAAEIRRRLGRGYTGWTSDHVSEAPPTSAKGT
ncbi:HIT family protein [Glycomyces buryatensis]|uniref:HIT family protein n=1 Tax=Glycomyces buryatensis TaxID=2570927 RepID=UPI001456282E|nr:HIT family protein [Glycomyces buryatensis]